MEKTSREYAEKLANKMLNPNWGHLYNGDELLYEPAFFKKEKERIIGGYLKAVEETNVIELSKQTALEFTKWKDENYRFNKKNNWYVSQKDNSIYRTSEQLFNEWNNLNNK